MGLEFKGKLRLSGFLATFTGLSIGKSNIGTNNAGVPKMVVRHPNTFIPFMPASAFRGALRRVLEKKFYPQGNPEYKNDEERRSCPVCKIFGASVPGASFPGNAIFRDIYLTEDSVERLRQNQEASLTEIKIYACMDRVTSQGNSFAIEQIPACSHFQFEIFYSVYQDGDIGHFISLLEGMQLLEVFSVGSNGSRGLGKIRFGKWCSDSFFSDPKLEKGLSLTWLPKKYYENGSGEQCLVNPEDKSEIKNLIEQKEQIASAIQQEVNNETAL